MSDSRREQILDAFVAALAGTTGVSTRIYRTRTEALSKRQAPALVVGWRGDQFTGTWVADKQDRVISVQLGVYHRANSSDAVPDSRADGVLVDAHSKVMANAALRALVIDIYAGDTSNEPATADGDGVFVTQEYRVLYRHSGTDLTT